MRRISSLCLSALLIAGASALIGASANAAVADVGIDAGGISGTTVTWFNQVALSASSSNWDYAELVVTNPDGSTQSSVIKYPSGASGAGTYRLYSSFSINFGNGTYGMTAYDAGYKAPDASGYRWSDSAHGDITVTPTS